ncbi:MAG TPA: glycosyltransferase 87 family protein, partial [Candidatus Baltobacteraceae bacterium]|nr:glycosyltransferase 87 family protein [Candidatus Baltobacteraceae bacterium]
MNARIVAGLILSALIGFALLSSRQVVALDFRAFYCSGMALREGHDPYRTQYLRACEAGGTDGSYVQMLSTVTLPAPQPTYDIALFSLASLLPFALAKAFWGALIAAAMFVSALALIRLTNVPPAITLAALAISLMGISISLGQIVPLYLAAACGAALLLKEGKPGWAALAATFTLLEPHLGLPLCVSLALWERRSRLPLALGAGTLAVLGLACAGWAENLEYFRTVLPLHALSELDSDGQLSLSVILHALGMADTRAVQIGSLSYLAVNAAGVWAARSAAIRLRSPALIAALPAATAVVGGSFMHSTEIVAAVPLALLLVPQPRYRA